MKQTKRPSIKIKIFVVLISFSYFLLLYFAPVFARSTDKERLQKDPQKSILDGLRFAPLQFNPLPVVTKRIGPAKAYLLEDPSLPYLTLTLIFPDRGLLSEPIERAGLLGLSLELLRQGGTENHSPKSLAAKLSELGTQIEFSYTENYWQVNMKCLSDRFDASFALLTEMLLFPKLDERVLKSLKDRMETSIDRRNERPASIARRKLKEVLFYKDRRGYSLKKADIKKITRKSIQEELRRILASTPILALSGDFARTNYKKYLKDFLDHLPATSPIRAKAKKGPSTPKARLPKNLHKKIYLIEKDVPQSVIALAGFLPPHNHPDFFALQLGNYILGGGSFNSRLMKEIRVKRGLAYYAYSYNDFRRDYGRFVASTATQSDKAELSLGLMLKLISSMKQPVLPEELRLAKTAILNSLVFEFDSPEKQLRNEIRFRLHEMPENYLQKFPALIQRPAARDIARAYQRHIRVSKLSIVVVGPPSLKKKLEKFRPVVLLKPEDPIPED